MGIILTILKIIGIALLAVLFLILLILLLVLLVPIRYSATGGKEACDFEAAARVTWLLHLISVRVGYTNSGQKRGLTKDVRVLGISILKKKAPPKEEAPKAEAAALPEGELTEGSLKADNGEPIENADFTAEPVDLSAVNEEAPEGEEGAAAENAAAHKEDASDAEPEEGGEESTSRRTSIGPGIRILGNPPYGAARFYSFLYPRIWPLFGKILSSLLGFMRKAIDFVINFWRLPWRFMMKVGETWMKLDRMRVLAQRWLSFLSAESTKQALRLSMTRLKRMLRHVLPRRLKGRLEFGAEDPSRTGMIYGAYSALYPKVGESFIFTPSFEEKKLNGEVTLTGKIVPGYLLWQVFMIIINKNTRMVIRGFLRMKEGKGNG